MGGLSVSILLVNNNDHAPQGHRYTTVHRNVHMNNQCLLNSLHPGSRIAISLGRWG